MFGMCDIEDGGVKLGSKRRSAFEGVTCFDLPTTLVSCDLFGADYSINSLSLSESVARPLLFRSSSTFS